MNILIDIGHPAHVHFFKNSIKLLKEHGHHIIVTSRVKEFAIELLNEMNIEHYPLTKMGKGGLLGLGKELIKRDWALYQIVKNNKIDIMAAIGGVSIAHVTKLTGVPSLVFYDTENATLQNLITYPFASQVIVPRCYTAWLPKKRHVRYNGYHELSYLHPAVFTPDRNVAIKNGLAEHGPTFFIRVVSWQASHDIGEKGWNNQLLEKVVNKLSKLGTVLISSESPLIRKLSQYAYTGKVSDVHHVLAYCKAFIGESATMASECAVMGVPAIYAAETGRGYTDEQESRFGLVKNIRNINWSNLEKALDSIFDRPSDIWQRAHERLLSETINVADFVADTIESYPRPSTIHQQPVNN
jgi:predicted glycosyltransferase